MTYEECKSKNCDFFMYCDCCYFFLNIKEIIKCPKENSHFMSNTVTLSNGAKEKKAIREIKNLKKLCLIPQYWGKDSGLDDMSVVENQDKVIISFTTTNPVWLILQNISEKYGVTLHWKFNDNCINRHGEWDIINGNIIEPVYIDIPTDKVKHGFTIGKTGDGMSFGINEFIKKQIEGIG